jgi:hypothetical protein
MKNWTYKFDKSILESKSKEILSLCKSEKEINFLIDNIVMATLGCEGDIAFWSQIKEQTLKDFKADTNLFTRLLKSISSIGIKETTNSKNIEVEQLLPDHLKEAAKTIGLDLTEVKPSSNDTILYSK